MSERGFPPDATTLVRVHKKTVQRVPCSAAQLNSNAAFICFSDRQSSTVVWLGKLADIADGELAKVIAIDIKGREMGDQPKFAVIVENNETSNQDGFKIFLSLFWLTPEDYKNAAKARERSATANSSKTLYLLEREGHNKFKLRELSSVGPSANGSIERMTFPELSSASMCALQVGDQWDLWIGDAVPKNDRSSARALIQHSANEVKQPAQIVGASLEAVVYGQNMRVVHMSYERACFRAHFNTQTDWHLDLPEPVDESETVSRTFCSTDLSDVGDFFVSIMSYFVGSKSNDDDDKDGSLMDIEEVSGGVELPDADANANSDATSTSSSRTTK